MNVAIDQGAGELPNDTSLASNGPRSEEISQNFPLDEEFEGNDVMQSVVQHDSDGYGDNDCNAIFDSNSGDEAKLTGDEGSGEENLQNSGENFPRGLGGASGIMVPPAAMTDPNASKLRRAQSKGSKRAQMMVGGPESVIAPAQPAVEVNVWAPVDEVVWPNNDTKFVGKDAVRGALNLPRDCGVKENQQGEGCEQNRKAFNFVSLFKFFTPAMVEMVVSETQKHVDRLAGLPEPPSSFLMARAGNRHA